MEELPGEKRIVSKEEFEGTWSSLTKIYKSEWEIMKEKNPIGKKMEATCLYSDDNGWFVIADNTIGVYDAVLSKNLQSGDKIDCVISGYDETNMAILFSDSVDQ